MTEQSKTPICDRFYANYPVLDTQRGCRAILWIDAEKIELAANAMAEKIRKAPHSDMCMSVLWNRRCDCWKSDALAEFEKLKI